jgi:hypothetical protein
MCPGSIISYKTDNRTNKWISALVLTTPSIDNSELPILPSRSAIKRITFSERPLNRNYRIVSNLQGPNRHRPVTQDRTYHISLFSLPLKHVSEYLWAKCGIAPIHDRLEGLTARDHSKTRRAVIDCVSEATAWLRRQDLCGVWINTFLLWSKYVKYEMIIQLYLRQAQWFYWMCRDDTFGKDGS